ncbi:MAG: sugar ABC transporter permease [Spirochaetales bacterium]|nr:sugar ABC transporter permease [Spirochaetales bacterium]
MVRSKKDVIIGIAIVVPSFILVLIFVYGFIAWTFRVACSAWDGQLPNFTWVGFKHFASLFSSTRFQIDLWNTLYFTILFLAVCICGGLVFAMLLDNIVRGENIFRNIFLFPMAISFVVTGVAWRWIFNPTVGVNVLLERIGLSFAAWNWYIDPSQIFTFHVALIPVVIAASWQYIGYIMAMFLAGLRGIPDEIIEAARMDGAGGFRIFMKIIIPSLKPIILSAMIVLGHVSLKIFDLVYTMTGKGPAFATDMPGIYMFETTFQGNHYAEGAAISIIMLLMVALVICPYLYYVLRKKEG